MAKAPQMKQCSKCRKYKPVDAFNKNRSKADGLQGMCRKCQSAAQKAWYGKKGNRKKHQINVRKNNKQARLKRRVLVLSKLDKCVDCGEDDKVVLEWDHVRGEKHSNIADMVRMGASETKILEELAKCEVVCANCHRKRTASRDKRHWSHKSEYASVA